MTNDGSYDVVVVGVGPGGEADAFAERAFDPDGAQCKERWRPPATGWHDFLRKHKGAGEGNLRIGESGIPKAA